MAYSVGEVVKIVDCSISTLYRWEKEGFIPKPSRSATNRRRYTLDDISKIKEYLKTKQGSY